MLRPVDLVMIGLLLGGAAFTFKVKQDSEAAIDRVSELEQAIKAEKDAIDVLQADWSLLTDPKRITRLVEQYSDQLPISAPSPESIGTVADIPPRPAVPQSPRTTAIADLIEWQIVDTATTGSVEDAARDEGAAQ